MTTTNHTVGIHQVERVLLGARREGVDVNRLLNRAGIPHALLDSPLARVSLAQYATLIRLLNRTMRNELWGLTETPVPLGSFAQCCRLLIGQHDLKAGLRTGFHFYRMLLRDFIPRLQIEGDITRITLQTRVNNGPHTFFAQRAFIFLTYSVACWLVARRIPLIQVDYMGGEWGARIVEGSRLFQAPIRYDQSGCGLSFESRWLDLPVVQTGQSVEEFLAQSPDNLLIKYRDQTSVTERIRRILRRHLAEELPSLEEISHSLGMAPQTLRRRLNQEDHGFQALKDAVRRDAAIEYLARPELSLIDISEMLGFSEPSTFHRAFKKWTGVAPGEYRNTRFRLSTSS
ncbi:MAG: AraC family transcriptional regulator [Magnetospirillum sp.]